MAKGASAHGRPIEFTLKLVELVENGMGREDWAILKVENFQNLDLAKLPLDLKSEFLRRRHVPVVIAGYPTKCSVPAPRLVAVRGKTEHIMMNSKFTLSIKIGATRISHPSTTVELDSGLPMEGVSGGPVVAVFPDYYSAIGIMRDSNETGDGVVFQPFNGRLQEAIKKHLVK